MVSYIVTFLVTSLGANFLFLVFAGAASGNANHKVSGEGLAMLGAIAIICIILLLSIGISLYKSGRKKWANIVGLVPVFVLPVCILWLWSAIAAK